MNKTESIISPEATFASNKQALVSLTQYVDHLKRTDVAFRSKHIQGSKERYLSGQNTMCEFFG